MIPDFSSFVKWKGKLFQKNKKIPGNPEILIVGVEGFEPPTDGVRVRCLTAWRHPSISDSFYIIPYPIIFVKTFFEKNEKIFFNKQTAKNRWGIEKKMYSSTKIGKID